MSHQHSPSSPHASGGANGLNNNSTDTSMTDLDVTLDPEVTTTDSVPTTSSAASGKKQKKEEKKTVAVDQDGENLGPKIEKDPMPPDKPIYQQTLRAWSPIIRPVWVIKGTFVMGAFLLILGIIMRISVERVFELAIDYTKCREERCNHEFQLDEDKQGPFVMYYRINGFYQNLRRYDNSRSKDQLLGHLDYGTSSCKPLATEPEDPNRDPQLTPRKYLPCGAAMNALFSDNFTMQWIPPSLNAQLRPVATGNGQQNGQQPQAVNLPLTSKDTDWTSARKMTSYTPEIKSEMIRLINKQGSPPNLDVRKEWVISNTCWMGGRGAFLPNCFIATSVLYLVSALGFALMHQKFGQTFKQIADKVEEGHCDAANNENEHSQADTTTTQLDLPSSS